LIVLALVLSLPPLAQILEFTIPTLAHSPSRPPVGLLAGGWYRFARALRTDVSRV